MASCAFCGSMILFGGKRLGDARYCSDRCLNNGAALARAEQVDPAVVQSFTRQIHAGACPKCQGPGPVDVYTSHQVWSALVLTSWSSKPQVCCRKCGLKAQVIGLVSSTLLGWWGFPWGLIMTPVQIIRNIVGMASPPDPNRPSPQLERLARLSIGSQVAQVQVPPVPQVPGQGSHA